MKNEPLPHAELVMAFFDGEGSPDERKQAEQLIAENPSYAKLGEEIEQLQGRFAVLPQHQLDVNFSERVLEAARHRSEPVKLQTGLAQTCEQAVDGESVHQVDALELPLSTQPFSTGELWMSRGLIGMSLATAAALALVLLNPPSAWKAEKLADSRTYIDTRANERTSEDGLTTYAEGEDGYRGIAPDGNWGSDLTDPNLTGDKKNLLEHKKGEGFFKNARGETFGGQNSHGHDPEGAGRNDAIHPASGATPPAEGPGGQLRDHRPKDSATTVPGDTEPAADSGNVADDERGGTGERGRETGDRNKRIEEEDRRADKVYRKLVTLAELHKIAKPIRVAGRLSEKELIVVEMEIPMQAAQGGAFEQFLVRNQVSWVNQRKSKDLLQNRQQAEVTRTAESDGLNYIYMETQTDEQLMAMLDDLKVQSDSFGKLAFHRVADEKLKEVIEKASQANAKKFKQIDEPGVIDGLAKFEPPILQPQPKNAAPENKFQGLRDEEEARIKNAAKQRDFDSGYRFVPSKSPPTSDKPDAQSLARHRSGVNPAAANGRVQHLAPQEINELLKNQLAARRMSRFGGSGGGSGENGSGGKLASPPAPGTDSPDQRNSPQESADVKFGNEKLAQDLARGEVTTQRRVLFIIRIAEPVEEK